MAVTRRSFVGGCSAAIAALAGSRLGTLSFGDPGSTNQHTLVVIFLRGGWDACNVIVPGDGLPIDRSSYVTARPNLQVPVTGTDSAPALWAGSNRTMIDGLDGKLHVHKRLMEQFGTGDHGGSLLDQWTDGNLAFVVASGLKNVVTRSHFDAQQLLELGSDSLSETSGWLARHLNSATNLPVEAFMTGAAVGNQQPTSLIGAPGTANFGDIGNFNLSEGYSRWRPAMRTALRNLLERDNTPNHISGLESLDAVDIIESATGDGYTPENGAAYDNIGLARDLRSVAQLIKLDLGLQVATIDYGGWDSHNNQGDGQDGSFGARLDEVRHALHNFYLDLNGSQTDPATDRVTVVVMSEFGRRLFENDDEGSDHGHGSLMMVMGRNINGGVYGSWPGLHPDQLLDNADLQVTTDYRQVLSEILVKQMCNSELDSIFPDYGASGYLADGGGLGLVDGLDYGQVFQDGFESGNTTAWG